MSRKATAIGLMVLFLATFCTQLVSAEEETEDAVRICCSAGEYDLLFIGRDSTATLTPFEDDLGTEERVLIENAVTQIAEIHSWEYTPGWGGSYPQSTWKLSLPYEVENAAGIEINATVVVTIGSRTYEGYSGPGNTYLPAGSSNILEIPIDIESASMGGTDKVQISLRVQTLVFSLPGTDAKVEFIWGTEDYNGFIEVELPLLDMRMSAPTVEGHSVFLQVKFSSGFGTKMVGSSEISVSAGGVSITTMPVLEIQGNDVLATWTWQAESSLPDGAYAVNISLVVQQGTDPFAGEISWDIVFGADGGGSGGVYYPNDEPPKTDGSGSRMELAINGELATDNNQLILSRTTRISFYDAASLWMRWGLNNLGNSSLESNSTWKMFVGGDVTDEMRSNRLIDDGEVREISQQLQSGRLMSFIDNGLFLESEELLGGRFSDFQTIEVHVDAHGENRIMHSKISISISTTQVLEDGERHSLVRTFLKAKPDTYWKNVNLNIELTTSAGTSIAKLIDDVNDATLTSNHVRLGSSESLYLSVEDVDITSSLSLVIQPTANSLYSPTVLLAAIIIGLFALLFFTFKISKNKSRLAIYLELPLASLVFGAYYLAYPMETLLVLVGGSGGIWLVTAMVSPRRLAHLKNGNGLSTLPEVPTIDCPKCSTTNPITNPNRPTKLPCGGCGVILKIVE